MGNPVWMSSCVRSPLLRQRLISDEDLLEQLENPRPGHLVALEVVGSEGAYAKLETAPHGINQPLSPGDRFFGVLANRFSGHNPSGVVPSASLRSGNELQLLSVSGIVGRVSYVPSYWTAKALELKIVGFPHSEGTALNLEAFRVIPLANSGSLAPSIALLTVCGSSAEVGKTSMTEALVRATLERIPEVALGAVKLCGTGRMHDIKRYQAAGARWIADFVDAGLASTYGADAHAVKSCLDALIAAGVADGCDAIILETGGDLLEAGAPDLLRALSLMKSPVIFVTSDALAAISGLSILRNLDFQDVAVASMRQNAYSLAGRLHIERAYDVGSRQDAADMVDAFLLSGLTRAIRHGHLEPRAAHRSTPFARPAELVDTLNRGG